MLAYKIGQTTMDVLRELHVGWQENTTISAVPQRMGVFVFLGLLRITTGLPVCSTQTYG